MTYFKYSSLLASLAFLGLAGLMLKDRQNRALLEFIPVLLSLAAAAALVFIPLKNQTVLLMTVLALWLLASAALQFVLATNLPKGPGEHPQWRRARGIATGLLGFLLFLYPVFPKNWTALLLVVVFLGEGLLPALRFYRLNKLF